MKKDSNQFVEYEHMTRGLIFTHRIQLKTSVNKIAFIFIQNYIEKFIFSIGCPDSGI